MTQNFCSVFLMKYNTLAILRRVFVGLGRFLCHPYALLSVPASLRRGSISQNHIVSVAHLLLGTICVLLVSTNTLPYPRACAFYWRSHGSPFTFPRSASHRYGLRSSFSTDTLAYLYKRARACMRLHKRSGPTLASPSPQEMRRQCTTFVLLLPSRTCFIMFRYPGARALAKT